MNYTESEVLSNVSMSKSSTYEIVIVAPFLSGAEQRKTPTMPPKSPPYAFVKHNRRNSSDRRQ
jgi:hypothetical protein